MDWGTRRRWVQAKAVEEGGLGGVQAHDAAQQRVAAILRGEHDVSAWNPAQFLQDGSGDSG
jgi:hypothetical protein